MTLNGQVEIPCNSETGVEFTNNQSSEVSFTLSPSGDWSAASFLPNCTPAGIKDFQYQNLMKYPNNTSFCLLAVNKQTEEVTEVGQETTLALKPGETVVFIVNDVPNCYYDNIGAIALKWSGISSGLKIESGTVYNGSYQDATWQLHAGPVGERFFTQSVTFESKFAQPPKVFIELSGLDVDEQRNIRVTVTAKNITATGLEVEYKTWYDTILYSVWANWMAFGE